MGRPANDEHCIQQVWFEWGSYFEYGSDAGILRFGIGPVGKMLYQQASNLTATYALCIKCTNMHILCNDESLISTTVTKLSWSSLCTVTSLYSWY